MTWEDVLKVRRRPRKKKTQPANPFAGESKDFKDTIEGKLEADKAAEAARQKKLDEEPKLTRRGRIRFHRLEETEEGHKIPDKPEKTRGMMGVLGKNRCTLCGLAVRKKGSRKLSRGKDDPNKDLEYCERCAGLLAGTLSGDATEFPQLDISAFKGNQRSSPRQTQWKKRKW